MMRSATSSLRHVDASSAGRSQGEEMLPSIQSREPEGHGVVALHKPPRTHALPRRPSSGVCARAQNIGTDSQLLSRRKAGALCPKGSTRRFRQLASQTAVTLCGNHRMSHPTPVEAGVRRCPELQHTRGASPHTHGTVSGVPPRARQAHSFGGLTTWII